LVAAAVVVVSVVVDAVVTELVTEFETLAELPVDDSAFVELEIDPQVLVAGIAAEPLLDRKEEPISPQPARNEVATATNSKVARVTLYLSKRTTK